jgi:heavy metal sensor kinase
MTFSIRTRLTFWYVTLLTVSLVAFSLAFSYSLSRIFINRVDAQIGSIAEMMGRTVVDPSGRLFLPRDFDIILERFFGIRTAGNYIQVLGPSVRVAARSSNLEGLSLPMSPETFTRALDGLPTYEVVRNVGRYPVRLVTRPVVLRDKGIVAIVQVGSSLEGMEEVFHSLAYIFILGIAASVAIAGVVGWFLAVKALKPVAEITRIARRIGAENLNERLDIRGPRDEIGMLASTMNDMIGRLERSFRQIRQFTADASHELKTPLTILKGEMEIALRSGGDVEQMREALRSGLEEIDRMSYIVRNLLDLARMDVEGAGAVGRKVNLAMVLAERSEQMRRLAIERGVRMTILGTTPAEVYGDPVRLGQLFFNLMDNALKYTPPGGSVELTLEESGLRAVFSVRDTGVGISREDMPHIFDRFYRVDKARTREMGGAGLGLSICREIADSMGGSIEVESEPGRGSIFTVRLPLAGPGDDDGTGRGRPSA